MNTDEIIEDEVENFVINTKYVLLTDPLRNAIRQAIKREREECAKITEKEWVDLNEYEIFEIANFCKGQNISFLAKELSTKLKEKNT